MDFSEWTTEVNKKISNPKIRILSLEVTRNCNLNCMHCGSPTETWNRNEELSLEEITGTLKRVAENLLDPAHFKHLLIVGGEPFVRKDLLQIIENAYNIKVNGKRLFSNTQIQTNGTYIGEHPEVLEKLKQNGVNSIGISIDGLEKTHDKFRRCNGCFKKAYKAVKAAKKAGFTVSVSTVPNSTNIFELPLLSELVRKELKPDYWRLMICDPIGRASLDRKYLLSPKQTQYLIKFLYKEHVSNIEAAYIKGTETKIELGCGGWAGKDIEGMLRPFIWHCIAGVEVLGILYNGGIGACSNICWDFLQGNIRKDDIVEVWKNRFKEFRNFDWKKIGDCKDCLEWEYCHGGPMHNRLKDGTMVSCLYQTIHNNKDYRKQIPEKAFNMIAGN